MQIELNTEAVLVFIMEVDGDYSWILYFYGSPSIQLNIFSVLWKKTSYKIKTSWVWINDRFNFWGWTVPLRIVVCSTKQWSTVACTCTASTFWSSYLNGSLWGSVLRVFLRWRKITARTDATRRDHMKLVVATRVSKGGDAETLTSWCTAQIISDLIFQSSSRVCLNGCWCGGGRLWSDSRRLFPGQWALLQPAEPPVSGWVRQLDRFTDRLIEWFKSAFYWGKMTILDIIYWPVCMCVCV